MSSPLVVPVSVEREALACPGLLELLELLEHVPDPRGRRGVRHRLAVIPAVGLAAVLAGAGSSSAIGERVADADEGVFTDLGGGGGRRPSEATIRRALGRVGGGPLLVSLLQLVRPTVERPARRKLYVLTGTFLVSTVGWLLLMSLLGPSELDTGFGELVRQISHDSSFIPKYFLGGAAGSVISAQTLEVSGHGPRFAYAVGALVVLFAVACVVLAYRRAWRGSTVPLLLVLMPVCLVGTLLVGRSMDALWMLAPWYGFNLRLFLVGAIWLLVRALAAVGAPGWLRVSRALAAQAAAVVLLVAVLGVSGFANVNQWRRQPAERAYFQNIQWALLFPQELVVGENGYTQIVLPLEESRRAIELLRKNHLSVYRDPQAVLAAMGDTGTYDGGGGCRA